MTIVNFDNSATTFPKPMGVKSSVIFAMNNCGGNAGRGGHALAMITSEHVYKAREEIADFFGAEIENTIFTLNCTHSLNLAIKGIMHNGGHIIMSSMEHNSVSRPIVAMYNEGKITYSVAKVSNDSQQTVQAFRKLINHKTKAIVCTVASNVTGQILPYKEIAELCKQNNICFIGDSAQASGVLPIKLSDGFNIICMSGHKGLYGISGTGLFITDGKFPIAPLMEGGTGSTSLELTQPDFMPDKFESGTINTPGILSMHAGIKFIKKTGMENIHKHENYLCELFLSGISNEENIIIYRDSNLEYVPIVAFNIYNVPSDTVTSYLNDNGFCLRGGFQCAALAHESLKTTESGIVRFAPSAFNNANQVRSLVRTIKKFK